MPAGDFHMPPMGELVDPFGPSPLRHPCYAHAVRRTGNTDFERELAAILDGIRARGLHRVLREIGSPQSAHVRIGGRDLLNFSSNDYLGLANHSRVRSAALRAVGSYGAGAGASRLISGSLGPHHRLEEALADFKGTSAALTFSSGYAAALGTVTALLGRDDIVVIDKLVHACVIDAARLCGAQLRVYRHNDLIHLESILQWTVQQRAARRPRVLVITESVFSMEGDIAPLREIVELKDRYGAWLMVDEAHATGLYGTHRRGLVDEFSLTRDIEIQLGTLGKALGSSGGFICGSRALIDVLINRARSFIFSTAPPPAQAAAALAAIRVIQSPLGERLNRRLWNRVHEARQGLAKTWFTCPAGHSPILPLLIGDEEAAMDAAAGLRRRGIVLPAIRYPSVARNQARLRLTLSAAHRAEDIRRLMTALAVLKLQPHGRHASPC
jgi:8-amino-7-oxononanoate synthase